MKRIVGGIVLLALAGLGLAWLALGDSPPQQTPLADRTAMRSEPSCPLLVLINERSDNPFGPYLGEILRAEGLNCFRITSVAAVSNAPAEHVAIALLAEGPLSAGEALWLRQLVEGGSRLIAMRPDARLDSVLGIERLAGQTTDGFLRVGRDHTLTEGIAIGPLQFHGSADHYRAAGAEVIAWISAAAGGEPAMPGITVHQLGRGSAIAWSFDLARSVVYTRQGNPAWVGEDRDGVSGRTVADLFNGWVALDRLAVPQADETQRLLASLIAAGAPLPRLWYFPGTVDGLLIATADARDSSAAVINEVLGHAERLGGHMSIYYRPPASTVSQRMLRRTRWWLSELPLIGRAVGRSSAPSPADVERWRHRGHEFGLQADGDALALEWRDFTGLGYGPVPPTTRALENDWQGWVDAARALAARGFRLDVDYERLGPRSPDTPPASRLGYFTGSGLPMRLVDEHGQILSIFQQATQLVDADLLDASSESSAKASAEAAVGLTADFLQRAPYTAVTAQFHVDSFAAGGPQAIAAKKWMTGTLGAAAEAGLEIWSAEQWLRFTEMRDKAAIDSLRWDESNRRLFFRLRSEGPADVTLSVLVPLQQGSARLAQMTVDGEDVRSHLRRIGAITYGGVSVSAGSHTVAATYTE